MESQSSKEWSRIALYSVVLMGAVLFGAWVYALPYITISQLREAAKSGDSDSLSEMVDFPLLRENLKEAFKAKLLEETTNQEDKTRHRAELSDETTPLGESDAGCVSGARGKVRRVEDERDHGKSARRVLR